MHNLRSNDNLAALTCKSLQSSRHGNSKHYKAPSFAIVERSRRRNTSTAIVSLEQLYPFPEAELAAELEFHSTVRDLVWIQEEPTNMGALSYIVPRLRRLARDTSVRSIKRSGSATPATGSAKAHELEQKTLLALAFTTGKN